MSRALLSRIACMLLAVPSVGTAQQRGWRAGLEVGEVWFGAGARAGNTRLGPSPGVVVGATLQRSVARWHWRLALDARPGVLRASDHGTVVQVGGARLTRTGLTAGVAMVVHQWRSAQLLGGATVRADAWSPADAGTRVRAGGEAFIGVQVKVGSATLEHRLLAGRSASPFRQEEMPGDYRVVGLGWMGVVLMVGIP